MSDLIPLPTPPGGEFLFYQSDDGRIRLQVRLEDESVWLTQKLMAELFQKDVRTVNEHIQNIFEEGELAADSVVRKFRITAADGKNYETAHYNLDVIISVGYRVKSQRGTQFRIWLHQRAIHYWGDIDTHGFAILDQLRSCLPHVRSMLMTREIFLHHRDFWTTEPNPVRHELPRLTAEEKSTLEELKANSGVAAPRLEQEKLPFSILQNALRQVLDGVC